MHKMIFTITKGMDGKRVKTIGKYSIEEIDKMFEDFSSWKRNADPKKYYVSSYERHLINSNEHKIVIDFGDYTYFGLIKASKKEWPAIENHRNKPVDLEV